MTEIKRKGRCQYIYVYSNSFFRLSKRKCNKKTYCFVLQDKLFCSSHYDNLELCSMIECTLMQVACFCLIARAIRVGTVCHACASAGLNRHCFCKWWPERILANVKHKPLQSKVNSSHEACNCHARRGAALSDVGCVMTYGLISFSL